MGMGGHGCSCWLRVMDVLHLFDVVWVVLVVFFVFVCVCVFFENVSDNGCSGNAWMFKG